jgi:hypothetical protein
MPRRTDEYIEVIGEFFTELELGFIHQEFERGQTSWAHFETINLIRTISKAQAQRTFKIAPASVIRKRRKRGRGLRDGRHDIVEIDNLEYYIPSSDYCFQKCIAKIWNTSLKATREAFLQQGLPDTPTISQYQVKRIVETLNLNIRYQTWRNCKQRGGRWKINETDRFTEEPLMLLCAPLLEKDSYHWVIYKQYVAGKPTPSPRMIPITIIKRTLESTIANVVPWSKFRPKRSPNIYYLYDVETFNNTDSKCTCRMVPNVPPSPPPPPPPDYRPPPIAPPLPPAPPNYIPPAPPNYILLESATLEERIFARKYCQTDHSHRPYSCGWSCVDSDEEEFDYNYKKHCGENCLIDMLNGIIARSPGVTEYQLFAHNGAGYDSYLFLGLNYPQIKFTDIVKVHSRLLQVKIHYMGHIFILKDDMQFLLGSLRSLCDTFKPKYRKTNMDHSTITRENYMERESEWGPYLKADVLSIAEIVHTFNRKLCSTFGESITGHLTIAGVALTILKKNVPISWVNVYPSPIVEDFIKEATYGGRIFHNVKHCVDQLICLDANSLYPAAMALYSYPTGPGRIWDTLERDTVRQLNGGVYPNRGIFRVTIRIPHIYQPVLPVRGECNYLPTGTLTGVWTDVDIQEATSLGGVVLSITEGIEWVHHNKIFKDLILDIYKLRKACGEGIENYIYKIILNSMYGKLLENSHRDEYTFTPTTEKELLDQIVLPDGQILYHYAASVDSRNGTPSQLGAFVLSYSRKIMNDAIKTLELFDKPGIMYGDTDSIYILEELMEALNPSLELGGFKNDYGEGKMITEAVFLGYKKYALKFNDGKYKFKYNGINFIDWKNHYITNCAPEQSDKFQQEVFERYQKLSKLNLDEKNDRTQYEQIPQTLWSRKLDGINTVDITKTFGYADERRTFIDAYTSEPYQDLYRKMATTPLVKLPWCRTVDYTKNSGKLNYGVLGVNHPPSVLTEKDGVVLCPETIVDNVVDVDTTISATKYWVDTPPVSEYTLIEGDIPVYKRFLSSKSTSPSSPDGDMYFMHAVGHFGVSSVDYYETSDLFAKLGYVGVAQKNKFLSNLKGSL